MTVHNSNRSLLQKAGNRDGASVRSALASWSLIDRATRWEEGKVSSDPMNMLWHTHNHLTQYGLHTHAY